MTLSEKISADFVAALKGKQERPLAILRLLKAAVKNQEIEKRAALSDAEIVSIIRRLIKQLDEAAKDFERGGRADLMEKNLEEIKILLNYLPPALSDEEARNLIKQAVEEARSAGLVGFGPIMGAVMKNVGGRVDGGKVREILEELGIK